MSKSILGLQERNFKSAIRDTYLHNSKLINPLFNYYFQFNVLFIMAYLNLLLNMSLQLLQLLCEGLLASGQLGHKGFFLLKLTTKLTCLREDLNRFSHRSMLNM